VVRWSLPDHDDHNPSFYIYLPGRWHCYGCGRGGDVIDLEFFCGGYAEKWGAMIALADEAEGYAAGDVGAGHSFSQR
jgi:hypothetical protein